MTSNEAPLGIGVIVAFVWAVLMVGWFIGRRHERRRRDSAGPLRKIVDL